MKAVLKKVAPAWRAFERTAHVGPIRDEAHYDEMVTLLDTLIDEIGSNEAHSLCGLLYIVGEIIREHDEKHYPGEDVSGADMLRFLMGQHGLKQSGLPEIGTQSVVSEVLCGKRKLNVRQIARLSASFGVSADVFIDEGQAAA